MWTVRQTPVQGRAELQMLQPTIHLILLMSLHLKPYKLQAVQKLAARDRQLRSQFAARAYELEHNTVFTNESKFHISRCASQGTEPSRNHLEHDSKFYSEYVVCTDTKVALAHFPRQVGKLCSSIAQKHQFFKLIVHTSFFPTMSITEREFSRSMNGKMRFN